MDLKMNKLLTTNMLHNEEVTAATLNNTQDTLIVGFKDGIIKMLNIEKDFEVKESYLAFSTMGNKKGSVSQVRVHPLNGALYASSVTGNFKLFRPKV
jgi:hypothetical protein